MLTDTAATRHRDKEILNMFPQGCHSSTPELSICWGRLHMLPLYLLWFRKLRSVFKKINESGKERMGNEIKKIDKREMKK